MEIGADYSHHEELDDHAEQRRRLVAGNSPEQVHIAYGIPAVSTMVVSGPPACRRTHPQSQL